MSTKVGIVTHYYQSCNYGGILQSYALCNYLNQNGFEAEQLCYSRMRYPVKLRIKHFLAYLFMLLKNMLHPMALWKIMKRKRSLVLFRERIPHTDAVFSDKDLYKANELFDVFITGSDQVWHPSVINIGYSLSFSNKPKYSYAASIASDTIPEGKKHLYDNVITFSAVSVRERKSQELLPVKSQLVVDPVFLLSRDAWDSIASNQIISEKYVFCYFLGDSPEARTSAVNFAKRNGLKTVHIPYLTDKYRKCDDYGDYALSKVSPNDFLSLIKNAMFVFTDSFHAICFSYIFKKQFFVFNRKSKSDMGTRIYDVLHTLELEDRYYAISSDVLSKEINEIDYDRFRERFETIRQKSYNFINSITKERMNE